MSLSFYKHFMNILDKIASVIAVISIVLLLLLSLPSCKEIKYVPVHHYDTAYINKTVHDSVVVRDSIRIEATGDTVFITEWKYIYKDHIVHDTLRERKIDSVLVPTPVEKVVVTNELTIFQKIFYYSGLILFCFFIYKFIKMIYICKK